MPVRVVTLLLAGSAVFFAFARGACADFVTLQGGGEIRGELLRATKGRETAARVVIRTLSGALVEVDREQVVASVRRRPILEEYETRRRAAAHTLEAEWALAEWCRANALPRERKDHLARVIALDPEHVAAHRGLGHIRDQGRWVTRDELFAARGYVKHKGKHVLPQEMEMAVLQQAVTQAEKRWYRQIKQWQLMLASDRGDRRDAAIMKLKAIDSPSAVPALVMALRASPEEAYRQVLVEVLAKIEGDRPVVPLAVQSVLDESAVVRRAAIAGVRGKSSDRAIPVYLKFLKDQLNVLVNRAATALAQLGETSAVPQLIEALVTRHEYQMLLPEEDVLDFLDEQDGPVLTLPPDYHPAVDGRSSAAPHAASHPHVELVEMPVEKHERNPAVLAALNLLTDENFDYDIPAWRTWYNSRKNSGGAVGRAGKPKP